MNLGRKIEQPGINQTSERQKSSIAALLTKTSSINVPYVRLNHWLSLMPCSWTFSLALPLSPLCNP